MRLQRQRQPNLRLFVGVWQSGRRKMGILAGDAVSIAVGTTLPFSALLPVQAAKVTTCAEAHLFGQQKVIQSP